jgi:hypothetical protein
VSVRRTVVGLTSAIAGGALVVTLTGMALHRDGPNERPLTATVKGRTMTSQGSLPHAFLHLSTYPDSMAGEHGKSGGAHPDWVSYGPTSSLRVPAHALVTMTIDQYDTGGTINSPYFATVRGTVDGTESINGKTVTKVDPDAVGHTFTIHAAPTDQDPLFVSVPLPAQADSAQPAPNSDYPKAITVTFSFLTKGPGTYVWNCEFPCGDHYYAKFGGTMATRGYMSGTLTVT